MSNWVSRGEHSYHRQTVIEYCRGLTKRITPLKYGGGYTGWGWHWGVVDHRGEAPNYSWFVLKVSHPDGRTASIECPLTARTFKDEAITKLVITLAEVMAVNADHILAELRGERKPSRAKVKKIR